MADIQILIKIGGAEISEAVPLAQDVIGVLQTELSRHGHTVKGGVSILCERCGKPMRAAGKLLVCDPCLADEATELELERRHMDTSPLHSPITEPVEAVF